MRLPTSIETYGQFWIPECQSERVSGVLQISDSGKPSLELIGTFRDPRDQQIISRILGVVEKGGPITLVDCIPTNNQNVYHAGGYRLSRSTTDVRVAALGGHFEGQIHFTSLEFSVEGLNEWFFFHNDPFSRLDDTDATFSVAYSGVEPIVISLDEGLEIKFSFNAGHSMSHFSETISVDSTIVLTSPTPRPFDEFMRIAERLKNLLCLALARPVMFTFVKGHVDSSPATPAVHIYQALDPYSLDKQNITPGNWLFGFHEVADRIDHLLANWLNSYDEFEPTFNLYFAVLANRFMHIEARFLFLVQGLESLHRKSSQDVRLPVSEFDDLVEGIMEHVPAEHRDLISNKLTYANELSLGQRLKRMIAPFGSLYGTKRERESLVNRIVKTRNYYTHYDDEGVNDAATERDDLARLYLSLDALLKLHLLRLSGFSDDNIVRIASAQRPLR